MRGAGGAVDAELVHAEQDLGHQQADADAHAADELAYFAVHHCSAEAAATTLDSAASHSEAAAGEIPHADHTNDAVVSDGGSA